MTVRSLNRFIKAQVASFLSTIVDFGITIFLTEACGIWYLLSTSTGSVAGGITNFLIGRKWVFKVAQLPPGSQVIRYMLVWGVSILLNISGVYLLTHIGRLNYLLSKTLTAVIIGIFFNYLLQKQFVFNVRYEGRNT